MIIAMSIKMINVWENRNGDGVGLGEPKDGVFIPVLHGFVLSYPCSLGPREVSSHCIKLYFLLIYPTISTIFLIKPISLIKIYFKLQFNLSYQINSIFRKN